MVVGVEVAEGGSAVAVGVGADNVTPGVGVFAAVGAEFDEAQAEIRIASSKNRLRFLFIVFLFKSPNIICPLTGGLAGHSGFEAACFFGSTFPTFGNQKNIVACY